MYPSIPKKLQDYHEEGFKLVGTETPISLLPEDTVSVKTFRVSLWRDVYDMSSVTLFDMS